MAGNTTSGSQTFPQYFSGTLVDRVVSLSEYWFMMDDTVV